MLALFAAVACNSGLQCPPYTLPPYVPPLNTTYVNLPLKSTLPTPATIPSNIIKDELHTMYYLWKSIAILTVRRFMLRMIY